MANAHLTLHRSQAHSDTTIACNGTNYTPTAQSNRLMAPIWHECWICADHSEDHSRPAPNTSMVTRSHPRDATHDHMYVVYDSQLPFTLCKSFETHDFLVLGKDDCFELL